MFRLSSIFLQKCMAGNHCQKQFFCNNVIKIKQENYFLNVQYFQMLGDPSTYHCKWFFLKYISAVVRQKPKFLLRFNQLNPIFRQIYINKSRLLDNIS